MGDLPKAGEWVRLEVDASKLGLLPGTKIDASPSRSSAERFTGTKPAS